MTENAGLISQQYLFSLLCNHVIQVTSWGAGRDDYGKPVLDESTTRQYKCLLQMNEQTRWGTNAATDDLPYQAYVLSVPIGGTDAVPIRVEEQITIIVPTYWENATPRRLGKIQTYFDQYGNNFAMVFAFD